MKAVTGSADRHDGGHPGLQFPREANRGGEALSLRERSSPALSRRKSMKCDELQLSDCARGGAWTMLRRPDQGCHGGTGCANHDSDQRLRAGLDARLDHLQVHHARPRDHRGIFVVVGGLLIYAIVRFRRRRATTDRAAAGLRQRPDRDRVDGDPRAHRRRARAHHGAHAIHDDPGRAAAARTPLDVTVIGHQWWWEIPLPERSASSPPTSCTCR